MSYPANGKQCDSGMLWLRVSCFKSKKGKRSIESALDATEEFIQISTEDNSKQNRLN